MMVGIRDMREHRGGFAHSRVFGMERDDRG